MKLRPDIKPSSTVHLCLVQYIITKKKKIDKNKRYLNDVEEVRQSHVL